MFLKTRNTLWLVEFDLLAEVSPCTSSTHASLLSNIAKLEYYPFWRQISFQQVSKWLWMFFCIINDKRDDSSGTIKSESIMWFLWHASSSSFIDERLMYSDGQEELYATIGKKHYLRLHIKVGYNYYHNNQYITIYF